MEPIVLNLRAELGETRYNGGWIKSVAGIDKRLSSGYSILGEFVGDGLQPLHPGLYLSCDIGGSRKNQTKKYTLTRVHRDAPQVEIIETVYGSDWAVQLWPEIDRCFAEMKQPDPLTDSEQALVDALNALAPDRRSAVLAGLNVLD